MTAEIAILNKSAVALAADSAVTIQSGSKEEKTYDSADKLFELCHANPIAVMVYNGLSFAEVPLQTLIKKFRGECPRFETVEQAAFCFLEYLQNFGTSSPTRVKDDAIRRLVDPVMERIQERFQARLNDRIVEATKNPQQAGINVQGIFESTLDGVISTFERAWQSADDASFVGPKVRLDETQLDAVLGQVVSNRFGNIAGAAHRERLVAIGKLVLVKDILSGGLTGIVIAGFGDKEIFPTLVSFEIDGMVGDSLKYVKTNSVDIDRNGPRSRVLPFAQKEMVDRFLYGLDDQIERLITTFCRRTAPDIRNAIMSSLQFESDQGRTEFETSVKAAEDAFVLGLRTKAFDEIRTSAQASIDSLIEFMPKPELAKMAEALVNLTSIKKRVSRGMDTVGGPIDVAVISQAEGFVWVKRKHYFPPELNPRYFQRVERRVVAREEATNDSKHSTGTSRKRGKPPRKAGS